MNLHWLVFFVAAAIVSGQNRLPPSPLPFRGLWSLATYSQQTQTYNQVGQIFFYNNGTFTSIYLSNPSSIIVAHLTEVNTPNGTNGTYQLRYTVTKGPSEEVNKTFCIWRQRTANGDYQPGLSSNDTCPPTFQPDPSPNAIVVTRNTKTYRLVDDENPNLVLSNTSFESTLYSFDTELATAIKRGVVFFGSSSIVKWTTLAQDFPDYTTLNRGFGGSTLREGVLEFKRIVYPLEPSALVIYSGENDISGGATPEMVHQLFRQLIPLIRSFYPNLPIAYISIKPTPAHVSLMNQMNQANVLIRTDIDQNMFPGVTFINVWPYMILPNGQPNPDIFGPDHEHMNSIGYAIWTKIVTAYLASI